MHGLYVITDSELVPGRGHIQIARAALGGGARLIQMRDKMAADGAFLEDALEIRKLTREYGAMFFVNDRVHVAAIVGADGVNVGQSDLPVWAVRKILREGAIVGVSVANLDEALQAQADGADYIGFGPVFVTSTKADAGPETGLKSLREVVERITIPVVAIGGINVSNVAAVAQAGAASAAVVSAVVCADDMTEATRYLANLFGTAEY